MKLISKTLTIFAVSIGIFLIASFALSHHIAYADAKSDVCQGVGLISGSNGCSNPKGSPSVNSIVSTVVNILSIVVGIIAVIMIIIGGLRFVLSGGDSNNTNSARNTVLYAVVGLVVVFLAQVIVRFVLNRIQ